MSTVSFYIFDYCKQILHKYAYVNETNANLYIKVQGSFIRHILNYTGYNQ